MTHEIRLFRPSLTYYNEADTPANGWALVVLVLFLIVSISLWGAYHVPLWTIAIGPVISLAMFYMSHTHVEKQLNVPERILWNSYNCLDPDVRAKIALDIPTLIKIGENGSQFSELEVEIDNLLREQKYRKEVEARLDPTAIVALESVRQAIAEEKQYAQEIRKVLGEVDEAPTPLEKARLSERIKLRIPTYR